MEVKIKFHILLLAVVVAFALAWVIKPQPKPSTAILEGNTANIDPQVDVLKSEKLKLEKAVQKLGKDNQTLMDQVAYLEKRKQKVKYIDVVKYETKEVVTVLEVLPETHMFYTEFDLPICKFESDKSSKNYTFKVLPVDYTLNIVKSTKETIIKIEAYSPVSEQTYEIPFNKNETVSVDVSDYPNIAPNFSLGVGLDTYLNVDPVVQMSFLHISSNLDLLTLKTNLNKKVNLGINVVDYKIPENKVFKNTWVGAGPTLGFDQRSIQITLSTKF